MVLFFFRREREKRMEKTRNRMKFFFLSHLRYNTWPRFQWQKTNCRGETEI